MKIYFYCPQVSGRGGMETVLTTVSKGLASRGHKVKIILTGQSDDPTWEQGLPVFHCFKKFRLSSSDYSISSQTKQLKKLLRKISPPDIFITMATKQTAIARKVANKYPSTPKVISWVHFSLHALTSKEYLALADCHICISSDIQTQLNRLTPNIPTHLIFNPIPKPVNVVKKASDPTLLYIGRLANRQKRIDKLLQALKNIKMNSSWKLLIVGDGKDRKSLMRMASSFGLEDRITWYGWQQNPWEVIKEATLLVLPSDFEGFPLVLVEALSHGIPVVSSDCPTGPRDIIKTGINGWLFPSHDIIALTDVLKGIIEGAIKLPSSSTCIESVARFEESYILDQFEKCFIQLKSNA